MVVRRCKQKIYLVGEDDRWSMLSSQFKEHLRKLNLEYGGLQTFAAFSESPRHEEAKLEHCRWNNFAWQVAASACANTVLPVPVKIFQFFFQIQSSNTRYSSKKETTVEIPFIIFRIGRSHGKDSILQKACKKRI